MKTLIEYIKENLDLENFEYKFDVWFQKDKKHLDNIIDFFKECHLRKIVTKEDVENFLGNNPGFKLKEFVDFMDENVKKDDSINVDYVYLFTKIIETFITNFNLMNKIDYKLQAINNGKPNTVIDDIPNSEIKMEEVK